MSNKANTSRRNKEECKLMTNKKKNDNKSTYDNKSRKRKNTSNTYIKRIQTQNK
jgi:hypothetical protein